MSKKFNIHDWQDNQKHQRLAEQDFDNDWKGLEAEVAKYIASTFATWMSPESRIDGKFVDNPPFSQEYAKAPYFDKLVGGIMDIVNDYEGEEDLDEANVTGTGTTISTGESPAYATPHAFGDDKEKKMKIYKSIGYKQIK